MPKIPIHPVALSPDSAVNAELFSGFYPLGCLAAYAKVHRGGALNERFEFGRITPVQLHELAGFLGGLSPDGGVFLLSSYVWNHGVNMHLAREVKRRWPGSLIVVGGPHIPRQIGTSRAFLEEHPYIDVAVRHEGEVTLADLLDSVGSSGAPATELREVDLRSVQGLTYRRGSHIERTPDRPRLKELDSYPSPYTTGEFDHWLVEKHYVPIETNRGCPYGCTFCDWGAATLAKLSRMSMDRVLSEIEFVARSRTRILGICDANFGILPRDVEIARHIVQMREKHGFPRTVSYTNAKVATGRLIEIVQLLRDAGLIVSAQISMQTVDESVLRNVDRANIKTDEYRKMIAAFHERGIPAVSDMMLGLPGQTFETCKKDLQFFFDHKVMALLFATSIMPNAPMAEEEYRKKYGIEIDAEGVVEATYSFTRDDYARMFDLCVAYKLFIKLGVLKYLLYVVQLEHGVMALDFLARWLERVDATPAAYPISARIKRDLLGRDYRGARKHWLVLAWQHDKAAFLFDRPEDLYGEVVSLLASEFDVSLSDHEREAILTANAHVLPRVGRSFPARVPLAHDVPGYFADLRALPDVKSLPEGFVRLGARGPGELVVQPEAPCSAYDFADLELTYGTLELSSNLSI